MSLRSLFLVVACAVAFAVPSTAQAHILSGSVRPYSGKTLTYYNATRHTTQMTYIARTINARTDIPITLKPVASAASANIVIGYGSGLSCAGGTAGLGGLRGYNKGFVKMARNCSSREAALLMAHEIGHALGLSHENRRCAVMNDHYLQLAGDHVYPYRCSKSLGSRNWVRYPFLSDDLAGFARRFRNAAPATKFRLWVGQDVSVPTEGVTVGQSIWQVDDSTDADYDIVRQRLDWGDGTPVSTRTLKPYGGALTIWAPVHAFLVPGTYTVTLTSTDSYGASTSVTRQIVVSLPVDVPDPNLQLP
jgi:hypothetical protein